MATNTVTGSLFAPPRIVRAAPGHGSLLLRSAEPPGDYPPAVLDSVRDCRMPTRPRPP